MISIVSLWLPILLSAVVVFILSSLVHMVFRYHHTDFRKLPGEDAIANTIRQLNIPAGDYMMPYSSGMAEMKSPEFQERMKKGPGAIITIWPGWNGSMTANLVQWFIYCVVVSIFSAYIASRALPVGAPYLEVFRFAGATAFFCYTVAGWQHSIWFKQKWSTNLKNTFDGLLYALFTAGMFGWLWPR